MTNFTVGEIYANNTAYTKAKPHDCLRSDEKNPASSRPYPPSPRCSDRIKTSKRILHIVIVFSIRGVTIAPVANQSYAV